MQCVTLTLLKRLQLSDHLQQQLSHINKEKIHHTHTHEPALMGRYSMGLCRVHLLLKLQWETVAAHFRPSQNGCKHSFS